MFIIYLLWLQYTVTLVYTHPANNKETRNSEFSTNDEDNFRLSNTLKDKIATPRLPILQRLNTFWKYDENIKSNDPNLKNNSQLNSQINKSEKFTEKSKVKETVTERKSTLMEDVYIDNDLEPEFEWDYLDQLQQDLADDYIFKDGSRMKRYIEPNISDSVNGILPTGRRKRRPAQAINHFDTKTTNPGDYIFTNTKLNIYTQELGYASKLQNSIDRKDSFDNINDILLKQPIVMHQDVRFTRDPKSKANPNADKTTKMKSDSITTTLKDYTIDSLYDPADHNVEITIINFKNELSTGYMTEFEPIHCNAKQYLRDSSNIPEVKIENDVETDKVVTLSTDIDAMNKYLNSKSLHNDLLYSEGNKDFNNEISHKNNNFQVPNVLQEYVKKYTSKTSLENEIPRFNNDNNFSKIYKTQRVSSTRTIKANSAKTSTHSETDAVRRERQDGNCLKRHVRRVNKTTTINVSNKSEETPPKGREITRRKRRKIKLISLLKEKLMFLLNKKNRTAKVTEKPVTILSTGELLTEAITSVETSPSKIKENKKKTTYYDFDGYNLNSTTEPNFEATTEIRRSIVESVVFPNHSTLKGNVAHKFDDVLLKTTKHKSTNYKETGTAQTEDVLYVEPTLFDDKIYYEESLKNIVPKVFKMKYAKPDYKVSKRDVSPETFTAKDVAALEVIVDLIKTNPNFETKTTTLNLVGLAKPLNTDNGQVTNSIQIHIAVPYDVNNDRKRSLNSQRVRKVFSAKMYSPVDLEYQVNSFEEPTPATISSSKIKIENEQIPPGMYLLLDNGVLKGNFVLKPVKNFYLPNMQERSIVNVTDKISTTSVSKDTSTVTLSKDMISVFNQRLLEFFKHMADNETETQIIPTDHSNNADRNKRNDINSKRNQITSTGSTEGTKIENETRLSTPNNFFAKITRNKRHNSEFNNGYKNITSAHGSTSDDKPKTAIHNRLINWDKIKQYFGHDRVCSCKCKVNKTLCKACAASDAVIGELIFEFDNLAKFMKDHCTEIQTYFWMNPTGGQKLRDSVHRLDKSLHDYYKRVKGKCQGKTCNTFTTCIDKRELLHHKMPVSKNFLNDLENVATDVEKAAKYVTCYDKKLIDKGDNLFHTINECILKRSNRDLNSTTIKNVYALDNVNVNIICKADTTEPFRIISASHFENIPATIGDIILDYGSYDHNNNSKASQKSKLNKLFTYYYLDKTTENFDIKKRDVNNQVEAPLNSDAGGAFWNDYINRNEKSRDAEEAKQDSSKDGVAILQTMSKGNYTTVTITTKGSINNTNHVTPIHDISELIRLFSKTKNHERLTTINTKINTTTHKQKAKITKPKKIHTHKTTKGKTLNASSSTKTIVQVPNKSNSNLPSPTSKNVQTLVTELSNITEFIDSSTPTDTITPKKSNNIFHNIKSATFDFLNTLKEGNFMMDENALKTTPGRLKNDLEKDVNEYIFTDNMISNITTAANPTIVIIQDYDDLKDEINNIDTAIKRYDSLQSDEHNLTGKDKYSKRHSEKNVELFSSNENNDNNFNSSLDDFTKYDDSVKNVNGDKCKTKLDDEIRNEKQRSLLLSIIDFQRDKLNDEWLKYVYSTNDFEKQSFEDKDIMNVKFDILNSNKNTKFSPTTTVNGDYDIVKDLKSLQQPDSQSSPAKSESSLLDLVHKFGFKILPKPKEQKVPQEVSSKSGEPTKQITKSWKLLKKKTLKTQSKQTELDRRRSSKKICDIEATYNHILKKYRTLPLKEFEEYVKNISCSEYKNVPEYFYISVPKKKKLKRSKYFAKWDWIRDRRSLKDVISDDDFSNKDNRYLKVDVRTSEHDIDDFNNIPDETRPGVVKITYGGGNENNDIANQFIDAKYINDDFKRTNIGTNENSIKIGTNIKNPKFSDNYGKIIAQSDQYIIKLKKKTTEKLNTKYQVENSNIINSRKGNDQNNLNMNDEINAKRTIFEAKLINDVDLTNVNEDFERYIKGHDGIYKIVKRIKRHNPHYSQERNLDREFRNLPSVKISENGRLKREFKVSNLTVPIFQIIFSLIYETNTSFSFKDLKAIQFLSPAIATLCYAKLNPVEVEMPVLTTDKENGNTAIEAKTQISIRPLRSINCSAECQKDITLRLVLLTTSNIPSIASTQVILFKDGVNTTLRPIADQSHCINVIIRCSPGYYLLKEIKMCALCLSNTSATEGDNKCSVCPRELVSDPASNRCHSIMKGTRRYDWWVHPQCGIWIVIMCMACGCGICVAFALLVQLTSYVCGKRRDVPEKHYKAEPKSGCMARVAQTCDGRKPPSPSRVVLARFFRPSQTSSRATDSQEIKHELRKEKNKPPPLPPIDFN